MIREVSHLTKCQEKQVKEYSSDPHEISCKDDIKVFQEVLDIVRNIMVAECSTQRKVEQAAETSSLVIMFNIHNEC